MKFGAVSRLPIGVKLPLAAGALVLVVVSALTTAAFVSVRRITMQDARSRIATLSDQLVTTYRAATTALKGRVRIAAADPGIAAFLSDSTPSNRARAQAVLRFPGPLDTTVVAAELRDAAGRTILSTGVGADLVAGTVQREWIPHPDEAPDSTELGNFRQLNDTLLVVPVVAVVPSHPTVRLIQWRRAVAAARAQEQVARIVGSEAQILFGNSDGTLWTDFARIHPAPLIAPAELQGLVTYTRPGSTKEVLASVAHLPGTPWSFAVEFPTRAVMAPVRSFLRTMIGLAVLSIALGLAAAWFMSRRLTEPLEHLTQVAQDLAKGDLTRRAAMARVDELGRLGASFDMMAGQVAESRQRLEDKVAERTRELNDTMQQLRDTQETLMRREKLALLGQLASGVGHELRNPLGVMSNAVYYLDRVQRDAPPDIRKYLGMLREQISLSAKIVNDLLDFSRVTPAERSPVEVAELAKRQLERIKPLNGIRVEEDFPDHLPRVHVDPVHAGQVVLNLVTNAVQAMGDSGTLRLSGRVTDDGRVLLEVSDTGPGVPPENLDKIFEPLFTTKVGGIGLGLAVSRSLAQANGGDLRVASAPGQGATFAFVMRTYVPTD